MAGMRVRDGEETPGVVPYVPVGTPEPVQPPTPVPSIRASVPDIPIYPPLPSGFARGRPIQNHTIQVLDLPVAPDDPSDPGPHFDTARNFTIPTGSIDKGPEAQVSPPSILRVGTPTMSPYDGPDATRDGIRPPVMSSYDEFGVARDGIRPSISYSGKNITADSMMYDPKGNPLSFRGNVTSLDTSQGHRQNLLELQRNAIAQQLERSTGMNAAGEPLYQGVGGFSGRTTMDDVIDKHQKSSGSNMRRLMQEASPRGRIQLAESMMRSQDVAAMRNSQEDIAHGGNVTQANIAQNSNATHANIARDSNATHAAIAAMQDRTAARGHELTNNNAAEKIKFETMKEIQDQTNKDRKHGFDVSQADKKHALDVAAANQAATAASDAGLSKKFINSETNAPDLNFAAAYKNAAAYTLGQHVKDLENAGDFTSADKLRHLDVNQLDSQDQNLFMRAFTNYIKHKNDRGFLGSSGDSPDPKNLDLRHFLITGKADGLQSRYILGDKKHGRSITGVALEYGDNPYHLAPNFGAGDLSAIQEWQKDQEHLKNIGMRSR